MKRTIAMVVTASALALAASPAHASVPKLQPGATQVALGRDAQIYQRGHKPGWQLAVADFTNTKTNQDAFGPTKPGWPAHPEVVVTVPPKLGPLGLNLWTMHNQPWEIYVVVYFHNHGLGQAGVGQTLDVVEPITKTPLHRIFTIPTTG